MTPGINKMLMCFGLLAGLLLGTGNAGGAAAMAVAGAAGAWLLRAQEERGLW